MKVKILLFLALNLVFLIQVSAQNTADWKWRIDLPDKVLDTVSNNAYVFLSGYDGNVFALDKRTGAKIWKTKSADSEKQYNLCESRVEKQTSKE